MKIKTAGGNTLVVQQFNELNTICFDVCKDRYEDSFHLSLDNCKLLCKHLLSEIEFAETKEKEKLKSRIASLENDVEVLTKELESTNKDFGI